MRKNFEQYNYQYYLKKDWVFPYSEIPKNSNIILYGAGDVGQAYYEQLRATGYCKVNKWVDRNFKKIVDIGLPVEDPEIVSETDCDYVVIAVSDAVTARKINREILSKIPQEKIIWGGVERKILKTPFESRLVEPLQHYAINMLNHRNISVESNEALRFIEKINRMLIDERKLILPRVVVELTPACTMRCKKCNNLMPLYQKPTHRTKEEIIEDIKVFMDNVDMLMNMELIGGEPFIYPYFLDVLNFVLLQEKIMEVEITTNGTIIPSEDILKKMQNSKVIVKISEYEGAKKTDALIDQLVNHSIRYELCSDLTWIDSGDVEKRRRNNSELKTIYAACSSSYYCKTLYKGRLYACARAASLYDLGICTEPDGYIEIRQCKDLKKDILTFFLKQQDPGCDYCDNTETWRRIPAGEQ